MLQRKNHVVCRHVFSAYWNAAVSSASDVSSLIAPKHFTSLEVTSQNAGQLTNRDRRWLWMMRAHLKILPLCRLISGRIASKSSVSQIVKCPPMTP
jgi:hypothetical protein